MPLSSSQIEDAFSATDNDMKSLLSNILYLNLRNDSREAVTISIINKLLSGSKTRSQGLEFLNLIVNNCSSTVVSDNALSWISHCLVKYPGDHLKEIKLSTIGNVIEIVYGEPNFSKKFVSDYMSPILEICLSPHLSTHETERALEILLICMKHYASWFAPHRLKIEKFLIKFLENSSERLVDKAALAFHYLQQVGGAGVDGINHKTNFSSNFGKLCTTVHSLFDKFFENEIEIDHSDRITENLFEFTSLPLHSQKMLHITSRRIRNCLKFITLMLQKSFPVAKEIKPIEVIDIISRGTAIHKCLCVDKEIPLEEFQFSLLLNKLQIRLLQLLRVFTIWLQANSLPFSFTITKILTDCLSKTQNCECFGTESTYQETVYKALDCWLRISRNSVHAHFQTQLVTCILKDITPMKNQITLSLQSDTPKHKSTKAKRKAVQERIIASGQGNSLTEKLTIAEKINKERNCLYALTTLKHILSCTTLSLNANLLQDLYTSIIGTMTDIQTSNISHPYTNQNCQAKLYEVLVAFYEQETLKVKPPLQLTLAVLNQGMNGCDRHIAITCEYGLSILEKLCQPICPSLFIPEMFVQEQVKKCPQSFIDNKLINELDEVDVVNEETVEVTGNDVIMNLPIEEEVVEELNMTAGEMVTNEVEMQSNVQKPTLVKENSIHILDMQVVQPSSQKFEPINTENENLELINNTMPTGHDLKCQNELAKDMEDSSHCQDNLTSDKYTLKREILSNLSIDTSPLNVKTAQPQEQEFVEGQEVTDVDTEQPPLKKCKTNDDNMEEFVDPEIKDEPNDFEEIDDLFVEGDDFVDEVKEY